MINWLLDLAAKLMLKLYPVTSTDNETVLQIHAVEPTPPATPVLEANTASQTYIWDTPAHAYHSTRVICDEMGLPFPLKNEVCATIMGESGFKKGIVHPNYVFKKGVKTLSSTDYGICQWNDYWHGKEITPDEALHNPEKAVRLMCTYFKQGLQNQWCAHSNGSYKQYLDQNHLQSLLG